MSHRSRILLGSGLAVLALFTGVLVCSSDAATCRADCEDGTHVSCTGDTCSADSDGCEARTTVSCGVGCSETKIVTKSCTSGGPGASGPFHQDW